MALQLFNDLIFSFENWVEDHDLREVYLGNFRQLFMENATIPFMPVFEILVEAFTEKQVKIQPFDFDFLLFLAGHRQVNQNIAIKKAEFYLQIIRDPIYMKLAFRCLHNLLRIVKISYNMRQLIFDFLGNCIKEYIVLITASPSKVNKQLSVDKK